MGLNIHRSLPPESLQNEGTRRPTSRGGAGRRARARARARAAAALAPPPRVHCPASIRPLPPHEPGPPLPAWIVGWCRCWSATSARACQGGSPAGSTTCNLGDCRENFHRVPSLPIPSSASTDSCIAPDPIPSSAASIRRGSGAPATNSSCASVGRQLSIPSLVAPVRPLVSLASASAARNPQHNSVRTRLARPPTKRRHSQSQLPACLLSTRYRQPRQVAGALRCSSTGQRRSKELRVSADPAPRHCRLRTCPLREYHTTQPTGL